MNPMIEKETNLYKKSVKRLDSITAEAFIKIKQEGFQPFLLHARSRRKSEGHDYRYIVVLVADNMDYNSDMQSSKRAQLSYTIKELIPKRLENGKDIDSIIIHDYDGDIMYSNYPKPK